ncbi:MAG: hypothetical protein ACTSYC_03520 [Promethearchaeota archaeon]
MRFSHHLILVLAFLIFSGIFEFLIIYFTFTDLSVLATRRNQVDYDLGLILILYLIVNLLIFIILAFFS